MQARLGGRSQNSSYGAIHSGRPEEQPGSKEQGEANASDNSKGSTANASNASASSSTKAKSKVPSQTMLVGGAIVTPDREGRSPPE